jgi:peptidoglycan/xylan/chitin deacetylase (PgdA/CDA1 family)
MSRAVPVLMYHHVTPNKGLVTVSPAVFEANMRWLAEHGWTTLTTEQFAGFLAGRRVPDKSVLVTFDDGYLDNWVYAHPVLARYGQTATLFTVSGWVGDGPVRPHAGQAGVPDCPNHKQCKQAIEGGRTDEVMLRWSEIETMRAAGTFEFHSHTHTHTRWDKQCTNAGEKQQRLAADLAASRKTFTRRLGAVSGHLCWPQGYFDNDYIDVARAAGFTHLYTVDKHINTPKTSPEQIGRIVTKEADNGWFARRMAIYCRPLLGGLYVRLRGK